MELNPPPEGTLKGVSPTRESIRLPLGEFRVLMSASYLWTRFHVFPEQHLEAPGCTRSRGLIAGRGLADGGDRGGCLGVGGAGRREGGTSPDRSHPRPPARRVCSRVVRPSADETSDECVKYSSASVPCQNALALRVASCAGKWDSRQAPFATYSELIVPSHR